MLTPKTLMRAKSTAHLFQRQKAILSAVALDMRDNAWAQELLKRRNAVARWRGQPGCFIRDVMQSLDTLPRSTRSEVAIA